MEEVSCAELVGFGRLSILASKEPQAQGSYFIGKVCLSLTVRPFLIRGLWVKLSGASVLFSSSGLLLASHDLLKDEEDYHCGGVVEVLAGLGETECQETEELLELNDSLYTWPFSFKIPSGAPFSYTDSLAETLYSVVCQLDSPAVSRAEGSLSFSVVVGCEIDTSSMSERPQNIPNSVLNVTPRAMDLRTNFYEKLALLCTPVLQRLKRKSTEHITIQSDQPAVFSFDKMRCILPVLVKLQTQHKHVSLVAKILLQMKTRLSVHVPFESNDDPGNFWKRGRKSGVEVHKIVLWESSRKVNATSQVIEEVFHIPLRIDPRLRNEYLSNWPKPLQIRHHKSDTQRSACLSTFTLGSPLFELTYLVEVTAQTAAHDSFTSNCFFRRTMEPLDSFCSASAEIFVKPPRAESSSTDAFTSIFLPQSNENSSSLRPAPQTPQANLAPVRVVGEAISRGPAALLVDRGMSATCQPFVTPHRFAQLHQVVAQGVDLLPCSPNFTPTLAYLAVNTQSPSPQSPVELGYGCDEENEETKEAVDATRSASPTIGSSALAASAPLKGFLQAISPETSIPLLAKLQKQASIHMLPARSIDATDAALLLASISSSTDREEALLILHQENCLTLGADIQLLGAGGCIDQCFPLDMQRGKKLPPASKQNECFFH